MPSPSAATHRYSREFMTIGPTARLYSDDDNTAENSISDNALVPPFPRFAPTLLLAFNGESFTLNAGNSYGQNGVAISTYAWSGGGSSSTKAYTLSTPGLTTVTCTVTDANGIATTGTRWVKVVNRPGVGAAGDQAITSFRRGPIRGSVGERGWSGCSVDIDILDGSLVDAFGQYMFITIYREEYERTGAGAYSLLASGTVFTGVITSPRLIIRKASNSFSFTAETIEALFQSRQGRTIDTDDHVFVNQVTYESNEVTDVMGGGSAAPIDGTTPATNALSIKASHTPPLLTVGWVQSHLLNWHTRIDVNGTVYRFPEVVDLVSDWWNLLGGASSASLTHLNVPRKPLRDAIADMLSDYLGVMYTNETGQVNLTVHHAGKTTPDANVDSIATGNVYELEPLNDDETMVRQVIVTQRADSKANMTTNALKAVFPASPGANGSLMQMDAYFTTQASGDAIAEAYHRHANANARVRVKLAGTTFGQFNRFTLTVSGHSEFPWTTKAFWVESNSIERNGDVNGGLVQEIIGRAVG